MLPLTQTASLELIETIVADHPQGMGVSGIADEIARRHGAAPNRRTLQRHLRLLVDTGRLLTQGKSIARIYRPPGRLSYPSPLSGTALHVAEPEAYVPLSPEGATIRALIRRPLAQRKPVGYEREFLESYQPGTSWYLPDSLRSHLHALGRTPATQAPAGTYARGIMARLLIDLSWASSRLEGNTYSRLDTQNLIEHGEIAQGKDLTETQMILNHKAAIEMLVEDAASTGLDAYTFKNLHAILSQDLMPDPATSGRLRWRPVGISGTVYYPPAVPQMLEDCFSLLLAKAAAIPDPFEQAFFLMVQLPYLQPFEDVNKRVSRLGANIPLIRHNLCPMSFVDVPELAYVEGTLGVYELNRVDLLRDTFAWAYERSCQRYLAVAKTMVEPDPLKIRYRRELILAVQDVVKGLLLPDPALIQRLARQYAAEPHHQAFAGMLTAALEQLHEGSVARYRLRHAEYLAWQHMRAQGSPTSGRPQS